jgi:hypothetical protein
VELLTCTNPECKHPEPRPKSHFSFNRKHNRYDSWCRNCKNKKSQERVKERLATEPGFREKYNVRKNKERRERYAEKAEARQKILDRNSAKARALRDRVLAAYGGPKCACPYCKDGDLLDFLTIDHIDNGGAAHRRAIGKGGAPTYRWLVRQGFPLGYQVLCWNCNRSKHLNGGVCAHVLREGSTTISQESTHEAFAWGSAGLQVAASGCYVDEDIVSSHGRP